MLEECVLSYERRDDCRTFRKTKYPLIIDQKTKKIPTVAQFLKSVGGFLCVGLHNLGNFKPAKTEFGGPQWIHFC